MALVITPTSLMGHPRPQMWFPQVSSRIGTNRRTQMNNRSRKPIPMIWGLWGILWVRTRGEPGKWLTGGPSVRKCQSWEKKSSRRESELEKPWLFPLPATERADFLGALVWIPALWLPSCVFLGYSSLQVSVPSSGHWERCSPYRAMWELDNTWERLEKSECLARHSYDGVNEGLAWLGQKTVMLGLQQPRGHREGICPGGECVQRDSLRNRCVYISRSCSTGRGEFHDSGT